VILTLSLASTRTLFNVCLFLEQHQVVMSPIVESRSHVTNSKYIYIYIYIYMTSAHRLRQESNTYRAPVRSIWLFQLLLEIWLMEYMAIHLYLRRSLPDRSEDMVDGRQALGVVTGWWSLLSAACPLRLSDRSQRRTAYYWLDESRIDSRATRKSP